jgi:DNA modification methylase
MEARVPEFLPAQAGFLGGGADPFWAAPGATLYLGDARQCLRGLPERSVHCVVTSPPYWGLRRYLPEEHAAAQDEIGSEPSPDCGTQGQGQCGGCFVCSMVGVFREVYRVLRDDGTVWLNLGDSYSGSWGARGRGHGTNAPRPDLEEKYGTGAANRRVDGLRDGNLVGVPWRVALALQADGWVLRSDVPWVKRSAMPDSAENRPGKCLEYVFLLAKGSGYYFDMDAVRPSSTTPTGAGGACFGRVMDREAAQQAGAASRRYERPNYTDRALRNSDLWFQSVDRPHGVVGSGDEVVGLDVTPHSARGQKKMHFAVFPPALITPLILASTSEHGCCAACGRPWERVGARVTASVRPAESGARAEADAAGVALSGLNNGLREGHRERSSRTFGWRRTCGCQTDEVVPAVVLDPFVGSGTAVATALLLGRAGVGIDLSAEYLQDNAVPRIEAASRRGGQDTRRGGTTAVPEDAPPPPRRLRGR